MSATAVPLSVDDASRAEHALELAELHCHPTEGAPYWIERARACGIGSPARLSDTEDLKRFGWMDEHALRTRPIRDFIPARTLRVGVELLLAETSGFLGRPKTSAWTEADFEAAFLTPFDLAASAAGFPREAPWLWLGPTGPHPIGQAARRLARRWSGFDPFCVDFDPRWFNRLAAGSFARDRYMEHLLDQAVSIAEREPIGVLFATPAVLERLADRMDLGCREEVRGIHYGGQPLGKGRGDALRRAFPNAVHLSGYGNSLFGVCMERSRTLEGARCHFPHGNRLRLRLVPPESTTSTQLTSLPDMSEGQRGRVVFSRFDESMMILNMLERDEAVRVAGDGADGFATEGLADPGPSRVLSAQPAEGIY